MSEPLPHEESFQLSVRESGAKRSRYYLSDRLEVLSRETYSRNPINYSEGMTDDQKDRYIQYLAG